MAFKTVTKKSKTKIGIYAVLAAVSWIQPSQCFSCVPVIITNDGPLFTTQLASVVTHETFCSPDSGGDSNVAVGGTDSNPVPHSSRFQTRLWFRDGDSHDSQERKQEHDDAIMAYISTGGKERWWSSIFSRGQNEGDNQFKKQENMDKHLEFLDRRYNRLRRDESPKPKSDKGGISTAWTWLVDTSGPTPAPGSTSQSMQDDALHILGVAELASERLMQKYHQSHRKVENRIVEAPCVELPLNTINISLNSRSRMTAARHTICGVFAQWFACKTMLNDERQRISRKVSEGLANTTRSLLNEKFKSPGTIRFALSFLITVITNGIVSA